MLSEHCNRLSVYYKMQSVYCDMLCEHCNTLSLKCSIMNLVELAINIPEHQEHAVHKYIYTS